MELIPELQLGWLNGWIPLSLYCLTIGILMMTSPRAVVRRLFDRSGWSRRQRILTVIGKLFALVCLGLIIFTPLKVGNPVFILGSILVVLGLAGVTVAVFNFRNTPTNQPVTSGLYRISRHPQILALGILFLGICIAIGSWVAMFALVASKLFGHFSILAEEESCLKQYGDSYRDYVKRVPRYFLFF